LHVSIAIETKGWMKMKKNNIAKDYARGVRITNRRKELRMTQDELASQIGIGRQALSAIENGGDFKVSVLNELTRVLNITADEVVKQDGFVEKSNLQMELIHELNQMDDEEIYKWLLMIRAVKNT
jgi:transcriptional regulator with XRE-family HTH domain